MAKNAIFQGNTTMSSGNIAACSFERIKTVEKFSFFNMLFSVFLSTNRFGPGREKTG
jgi:hypothetical protein